jgi:hypothetical protein
MENDRLEKWQLGGRQPEPFRFDQATRHNRENKPKQA